MSALSIQPTYPIFTGTDGLPLENGYIWIGEANLDPQGNPINIYWDAALTIAAPQPIRTLNGYPSRNGTPARLYVDSNYSIRVMNKNGGMVYSAPEATEIYSSELISFIQAGTGAVQRTAQDKMREVVSVKDFGAVGDGVADDTVAIQAAFSARFGVEFPRGVYRVTSTISVDRNISVYGNNSRIVASQTPFIVRPNITTSVTSISLTGGDETCSAAALPGVQVGSTVTFRSNSVRYNAGAGLEYYYGQTVKIVRINAGTAYFYPGIFASFTVDNVDVADPCEGTSFQDLDIDIRTAPTSAMGLDLEGSTVKVSNVNVIGNKIEWTYLFGGSEQSQRVGINVDKSVDVTIQNCNVRNIRWTGSSWGYGIAASGSNIEMKGGTSHGCRHATESGQRSYVSVNVRIDGIIAEKDDTIPDWIYAVGAHANVVNLTIANCAVYGKGMLIAVRGGQGSIVGNALYQNKTFSFADGEGTVAFQEMGISSATIAGNTFAGLPNNCIEIYTGTGETNYKLGVIGNSYVDGSTPVRLSGATTFSFDSVFSDTLSYGLTRNGYSVRYPQSYAIPNGLDSALYHNTISNGNSNYIELWLNDAASSPFGHSVRYTLDPNGTSNDFVEYKGGANLRFAVRSNGNAVNTTGSYGAISDIKLKQDVIDASTQWDDIKAMRFRKYRMKSDVVVNPDAPYQMGLIAQEVEIVSPGLVEESPDRDNANNDLGTTTKTVKYSVLYMKAVKALQEAMERIEALEAKVGK